jgi:DNA ligase-1
MPHIVTKPMLAPTEIPESFSFPLWATPKLDGIRALHINANFLSRTFKNIPNEYIRKTVLSAGLPEGLDGELIIPGQPFNIVSGSVMRESGEPDFRYYIFDYVSVSLSEPYEERMERLAALTLPSFCVKVLPKLIKTQDELDEFEAACLELGMEGFMARLPGGGYKCGRSTLNQKLLLKGKRFHDSEAKVVGFVELMHNENEAEQDAFGRTKRSSAKEGLVPAGMLGKFIVEEIGDTPWKGKQFGLGTGQGLTPPLRKEIWEDREKYLGTICKYKYQLAGTKDLPRLPIWLGFRDLQDM